MKRYFGLLFILTILMMTACTKADEGYHDNVASLTFPIASFYVSGNEGPAPVEVTFHNSSEYSDKWEWSFHNGATSNEFEPTRIYHNNTGNDVTYLVILKVTDTGSGETNTRSKSIVIHPSK